MEFLAACAAVFLFVALKSAQQRNVAFDYYILILPTSLLMGFCEFFIMGYVALRAVEHGFSWAFFGQALLLGLSAGLGSLTATVLHGKFLRRHYNG
jgi:hypothetical protein